MINTTKLLINIFICHLALIPAFMYGEWWMFVASVVWWYVIAIVAISGGYHRFYSHRAFKAGPVYEHLVNFLVLFSGGGPALNWAATHIQHHVYSDEPGDPHSPKQKGFWRVFTNTWGYDVKIERRFLKKLMKNRILMWWKQHYFTANILLVLALLTIDPLLFVFAYAIPVVLSARFYGILNALGHRGGAPRNSILCNFISAGEGDHAYHHDHPGDIRITKWFDPTYYFIKVFFDARDRIRT